MKLLIILIFVLGLFGSVDARGMCFNLPIVGFDGWRGDLSPLLDGFCVDDGVDLWHQEGVPTWHSHNAVPDYFTTRAIWQNRGVIEASAAYNGLVLDGFDGAVALNSCAMVGSTVWVRKNASEPFLRTIVADCSQVVHVYFHTVYVDSGIELSYELAEHYGMFEADTVGLYGFEVCTVESVSLCVGDPVDYRDYFLENLEFR